MYKAKKDALYENRVSMAYREAAGAKSPLDRPCRLVIDARLSIPQSASKKKKAAMLAGEILPGKRPDLDNVAKAVLDGLNTIAFLDDALVCEISARKVYSDTPCVIVRVEPISPETE